MIVNLYITNTTTRWEKEIMLHQNGE